MIGYGFCSEVEAKLANAIASITGKDGGHA